MPKNKAANMTPLNIILLGDPAAGKATQAAFLVEKLPLMDFDMGKELRKYRKSNKQLNDVLKNTTDRGNLTPTQICREIFVSKVSKAPLKKGILFNGTPKMIGEAKLVAKLLKNHGRDNVIFLYLAVPMSETVKRMENRVEYFKGKYSKRHDDNAQALMNRVKYYRTQVFQVVEFFKSKYPYKKISGLGDPEEVKKRIVRFVEKYI